MSPRPYRLGQRQAAAEQTRERIVDAARTLLAAPGGFAEFTIDAVARAAGVARMTVYHQFGSKRGLLEALFDALAARGLIERLGAAFGQDDPRAALAELIAAFGGFWASDRLVLRRIRGLAALDPDFEQAVRARDERRREALRVVLGRLSRDCGQPVAAAVQEAVDVLHSLTSFESFDSLAGTARGPEELVPLVHRLALAALGLEEGTGRRRRGGKRRGGRSEGTGGCRG
jgi:AcrR family transcriptional regulator